MKKRFFALLCGSVLLLSTLAGCANTATPESDTVLGEAMEQQIRKDFGQANAGDDPTKDYENAAYISKHIEICSYMGVYNGYTAVCIDTLKCWQSATEWCQEPIADYDFVHGSDGYRLLLYKDGVFTALHDAYEQALVNDEDIKKMYEQHIKK